MLKIRNANVAFVMSMISEINIQIGYGDFSICPLRDANDEWVWMRIYELRDHGMDCRFKVQFNLDGQAYTYATPRQGNHLYSKRTVSENLQLRKISQLWDKMGLHKPDYTAGGAVLFLRRLRKLFPELNHDNRMRLQLPV
ncbi:MAG: hypothetical protein AAF065_08415 [Verrucomicrobiota bacterium]